MENIRADSEVQLVEKQTPTLVEKASSLQIANELTSKLANDILVGLNSFQKKLEVRRKFFVKPLQDHVKTINGEFKKLSEPLAEAYAIVREKLTKWCMLQEAKQKEIAKKTKIEADKKSAASAEFLGEAPPPPVEQPKQATGVKSSLGSTHTKKVWTFEVEDKAKVPDAFKLINEPKVNATIKAGINVVKGVSSCDAEIDGIKIFQKTVLAVR